MLVVAGRLVSESSQKNMNGLLHQKNVLDQKFSKLYETPVH